MGCKYINTGTTYLLKKKKTWKKVCCMAFTPGEFCHTSEEWHSWKGTSKAVKIFKYSNPYEAVRSVNKIGISYVMYFNLHMLLEYWDNVDWFPFWWISLRVSTGGLNAYRLHSQRQKSPWKWILTLSQVIF